MGGLIFFIFSILLIIAGVGLTFIAKPSSSKFLFLIPAVIGILGIFFSITTVVDARSVGVQTAFGRYQKTLDNGLHFTPPWSSVEQFPTTIQTVDIAGNAGVPVTYASMDDSGNSQAPSANLAGGGKGTFDGNYAWSLSPDGKGADQLWSRYRSFERVSNELVAPASRDAVVAVGSTYSALRAPVSQPEISKKIKAELQKRLAPYGIVVDRVSITSIQNDQATQARLDGVIAAQANTRRSREEQVRAKIDAETTKIREKGGALTPAANQRYCLELVNAWNAKENGPLPATFNCQLNGGGSPVLVQTK